LHTLVGRIRRSRRIRHEQSARCQHSETDAKSVGFFMSILSDDRLNWPRNVTVVTDEYLYL
ncbi:hypothetical protein, partial [Escherichia albertii]|uniref:hypothetical protein n=1 Tax=Escherichia albertii TaxID=208962 RepID=UPI001CA90B2B